MDGFSEDYLRESRERHLVNVYFIFYNPIREFNANTLHLFYKEKYNLFIKENESEDVTESDFIDLEFNKCKKLSEKYPDCFVMRKWVKFLEGKIIKTDGKNNEDYSVDRSASELENIFKVPFFDLCLVLLKECDIVDDNHKNRLGKKGSNLYGVIYAVKKNSNTLLKRNYTLPELLHYFNNYLGTTFKQVKPGNQGTQDNLDIASSIIQSWQK